MISKDQGFKLFSSVDDSCTEELQKLGLNCRAKLVKGGVFISFSSIDFDSLSKIAHLPVKGLDFSKVSFPDLNRIKIFAISELWIPPSAHLQYKDLVDFQLETLVADGVLATDFQNLSKQPLKNLSLEKTSLSDLNFSDSLELKSLNIAFTNLSKIDSLASQQELESLNLFKCNISQVSNLSLASLSSLNISGNPISDLTFLEKSPLKSLEMRATKVSSLDPLCECPLERLYLPGSKVEYLSSVSRCPIKELNIVGLSIKDLQDSIRQMPLQRLVVSPDKVTQLDLHFLKEFPIQFLVGPGDPQNQSKLEFFTKYSNFL